MIDGFISGVDAEKSFPVFPVKNTLRSRRSRELPVGALDGIEGSSKHLLDWCYLSDNSQCPAL